MSPTPFDRVMLYGSYVWIWATYNSRAGQSFDCVWGVAISSPTFCKYLDNSLLRHYNTKRQNKAAKSRSGGI